MYSQSIIAWYGCQRQMIAIDRREQKWLYPVNRHTADVAVAPVRDPVTQLVFLTYPYTCYKNYHQDCNEKTHSVGDVSSVIIT